VLKFPLLIHYISSSSLFLHTLYALVDWNAEEMMRSMKSLIAREAVVIRDGKQQIIKAADIVVGGVVIMSYKSAL